MDNNEKEKPNDTDEQIGDTKNTIGNSDKTVSSAEIGKSRDLKIDAEKTHKEPIDLLKKEIEKIQDASTKRHEEVLTKFKETKKGTKKAQDEILDASKEEFIKLEDASTKRHKEVLTKFEETKDASTKSHEEVLTKFEETKDASTKRHEDVLTEFEETKKYLKKLLKEKDETFQSGCYMMLAVKIVLMIAVVVFYCSSTYISEVKSCELKTALDSVYLKYTFQPCKYGAIKEMSDQLSELAEAQFWSNSFLTFFIILSIYFSKGNKCCLMVFFCFLLLSEVALLTYSAVIYTKFTDQKNDNTNIDYGKLQSTLLSWIQKSYQSDNMSNTDEISRGWNNFFIQYDCCAVREVQGTANDFDNSPWCTTSGSCQATASQIPRTCCNFVTQDDYQNAPTTCHASVNPGTYRPNCIGRIRGLGVVDIDECQVSTIGVSLLSIIVLQVTVAVLSSVLFIFGVIRHYRLRKKDV